MTIDWAFLDPWHDALCASLNKAEPTENGIEMQVSFEWSFVYDAQRKCSLLIHLEEGKPQNVLQLIQIREAIELFTVLSTVNNKAFTERFPQLTQSRDKGERKWYPSWKLYVYGAAAVHQVTWSRLFECLDSSPPTSTRDSDVRGVGTGEHGGGNHFQLHRCAMVHDDENDTLNGIKTYLRRLLNAGVPLIMQLGLPPVCATQVDIWQDLRQQGLKKVDITFTIHDLTTAHSRYLTAGLVSTPINSLRINFDEETITSDEQATINAGVLLSRVYEWSHVTTERMTISCKKVSKGVFAAICSTIAVRSNTTPISFNVHSVDSESWPWLVYAVCCGPSVEISLTLWNATLVDVSNISDVVRYRFPQLKEQSRSYDASELGFVDILEGTKVSCIDFEEDPAPAFVVPSCVRCRAWFKDENIVEVVVPGFGRCRTRIGDGVSEVLRDSEEQNSQVSSSLRSLEVSFTSIESAAMAINLLDLIGRNLRNDFALDLSVLSAVCPNLQSLKSMRFDVVASAHNEALRLWPIEDLDILDNSILAGLASCLRNPDLRMTRELEDIYLEYDERDGEDEPFGPRWRFPLCYKGEVPIQSKTAMTSVITSAQCAVRTTRRRFIDYTKML